MFSLCEGMKWAHLPVGGGLYDQHPDLLEKFLIIFHERAEHEAAEERKRKAEAARGKGPGPRRIAGRRR